MVKTAREWAEGAFERLKTFKPESILPALKYANEGAIDDYLNSNGNAYYQWSACLIDIMKPKQVVELGGAMGVWTICALHYLPQSSKIYSVTLEEHGLEFSYIQDDYPNLKKIVGDDLDMNNWPKDMKWEDTNLIFFDSLHTKKQLTKEVELYIPLLKKGTVMLFDDIHMSELESVWDNLPYDKHDITNPCHYSGYGIAVL